MFATGIECSYPTIPDGKGGKTRIDEMAKTGHYEHWRQDFELTKGLGIGVLRYGPPYYKVHLGPGRYDWDFADETFGALKDMGIVPIADLCHFGVPDWIGGFDNEDWPSLFAEYAAAFAKRYPWVSLYTPVNEIYTVALYSGLKGMWNEAQKTDAGFVRALLNLCRANVLATNAILKATHEATFVQSEASQYFHPANPGARDRARFLNERRFLSLDLSYAHSLSVEMFRYLLDNGMREAEYDWFQSQADPSRCIMGTDYYGRNEHVVDAEGKTIYSGTLLGYSEIVRQYHERYRMPIMLTETNTYAPQAVDWLRQTWANVDRLREEGLPVVGYTWYSLTDQVDWDSALTKDAGHVDSFGLVDLDRNLRDVGEAYRDLVAEWRDALSE